MEEVDRTLSEGHISISAWMKKRKNTKN